MWLPYPMDSSFVVHVSKLGNDANGGLALQYPISLTVDAKLTIASAVSAVPDGGTIVIWPGTYAENVDIATAAKKINLIGTNRRLCLISPATGTAVTLYNGCIVANLSAHSADLRAIEAGSYDFCRIYNCHLTAVNNDAIRFYNVENGMIEGCYCETDHDVINVAGKNIFINNCQIVHTGNSVTTVGGHTAVTGERNNLTNLIIRNSIIIADPSWEKMESKSPPLYEVDHYINCFNELDSVVMDNCRVYGNGEKPDGANANAYFDGDMWAFKNIDELTINNSIIGALTDQNKNKTAYCIEATGKTQLTNCSFEATGQANSYELYATSAQTVKLLNCSYDSSKIHSNVTVHAVPDANGRVDVGEIEGVDATDQIRRHSKGGRYG